MMDTFKADFKKGRNPDPSGPKKVQRTLDKMVEDLKSASRQVKTQEELDDKILVSYLYMHFETNL